MHDARVQHAGQAGRRRRTLPYADDDRRDRPHRDRRADDLVLADRLPRRVRRYREAEQARQAPGDRDRQVQLLVLDEVAVADALAAAGDDAVRDREVCDGNSELRRSQAEERLVGERRHGLDVWVAEQEPGRDTPVGRLGRCRP